MSTPVDPVERGKAAIVEHLSREMSRHRVDATELVFSWEKDLERDYWNLIIYKGNKRRHLRFLRTDVEVWEQKPEIAGRYAGKILELVDRLLSARWDA